MRNNLQPHLDVSTAKNEWDDREKNKCQLPAE